eukprot:m.494902 g.494902  ORF g.494902 m.494902 type:complete len:177 (+) comp57293_c0_seq9:74-604(+)
MFFCASVLCVCPQCDIEDLFQVSTPKKMWSALQQEFDLLPPAYQHLVKVASAFRAFTPSMLFDAINIETSKKLTAGNVREYIEGLVAMDVFEVCADMPRAVIEFHPSDRNSAQVYQFASKLLQDQVATNMTTEWKQILHSTISHRLKTVAKSVTKLQARFRGVLARRVRLYCVFSA